MKICVCTGYFIAHFLLTSLDSTFFLNFSPVVYCILTVRVKDTYRAVLHHYTASQSQRGKCSHPRLQQLGPNCWNIGLRKSVL